MGGYGKRPLTRSCAEPFAVMKSADIMNSVRSRLRGKVVLVEVVGMSEIMGFSHVDLTVADYDRAVQ
jgi:hypothetical protein